MGKAFLAAGIAVLAAVGAAPVARATLLQNGSFEQLNLAATPINASGFVTLHPGQTSLTGWAVSGNTVDVVPGTYWQASNGNWSVDLTGTPGVGALTQVVATSAGTTYKLTFDLSSNPENLTDEATLAKKLRVSMESAGNVLLNQVDFSTYTGTRTKSNMMYVKETLYFTANSTATAISLASMAPAGASASGVYTGPVIDNLDLEPFSSNVPPPSSDPPAVPEPASMALLGIGAAACLMRRGREVR